MSISASEVLKVAKLAKLHIADESVAAVAAQMARIVDMVEQLKAVDTSGVEPLAHAMDLHSVLRADIVREGLSREQALRNAPQHDQECFRVPAVI
ncbi:MAG: Asp-tRNA(Asn)/Glu-tRNA(Gln) amidotransferase subunit GatC [Aureliella sp.]